MGDTGATVLVGVDNTEAVHGFIALERQQYFFNDDFYVADLGFYVDPSYRMTTLPIRLLAAAEAWAKLQGNALVLGITAPTDAAKLTKTYSKLGYSTWGTVMRKEF
jgi:GNAT superfamily N-acetyltransferase